MFVVEMIPEEIAHLVAVLYVFPAGKFHAVGVGHHLAHLNAEQAIVRDGIVLVGEMAVVGGAELDVQLFAQLDQLAIDFAIFRMP